MVLFMSTGYQSEDRAALLARSGTIASFFIRRASSLSLYCCSSSNPTAMLLFWHALGLPLRSRFVAQLHRGSASWTGASSLVTRRSGRLRNHGGTL